MADLTSQKVFYNDKTDEVVIRKRRTNGIKAPFSAIGPLNNAQSRSRRMQPDIFDQLEKVSKGAFEVFNSLKFHRSIDTNLTTFPDKDNMTRTQRETLSRRLRELKDVDVVRPVSGSLYAPDQQRTFKVRRGTLIINPEMIRCSNHDEAAHYWKQCAEN